MKYHTRKYRRRKKSLLLVLFVFVFIIGFGLAIQYNGASKTETSSSGTKRIAGSETYYVPISHYTDKDDDITFSEIKQKLSQVSQTKVYIAENDRKAVKEMLKIEAFAAGVNFVKSDALLQKIAENPNSFSIIPFDQSTPRVKTLSVDGQYLWDEPKTYSLKVKAHNGKKFDPEKITRLTAIGDVILGRHVAAKMREYNDYNHPWLKLAEFIKKGDITFADLEVPLSNIASPPDTGMSFIAPQAAISGLKLAGIDIVGLANNHSTNFGEKAITDTMSLLASENIKYCGAGKNKAEAYRPVIIEKNGQKFAFLDFNSIIGALNATDDSAGVAKFDIKPWSDVDNQSDINRIKELIKEAKKEADIAVVQFHWGVEYEPVPIESQKNVAHEAIDAGADVIIGTHPHTVQGMEYYHGAPILYSLGNFIFDQEWSVPTKQGTVAESYFYDNKLVSIRLTPYQIEDYNQPDFANQSQKNQILSRIFDSSQSIDYKY